MTAYDIFAFCAFLGIVACLILASILPDISCIQGPDCQEDLDEADEEAKRDRLLKLWKKTIRY